MPSHTQDTLGRYGGVFFFPFPFLERLIRQKTATASHPFHPFTLTYYHRTFTYCVRYLALPITRLSLPLLVRETLAPLPQLHRHTLSPAVSIPGVHCAVVVLVSAVRVSNAHPN